MNPDQVNGFFEGMGGLLLLLNCRRMYKDKEVKGVSIIPCLFFITWSFWNLYFYPWMGAWWSFGGGVLVAAVNSVWLSMVFYYQKRSPSKD